jgi:hypothetical protein
LFLFEAFPQNGESHKTPRRNGGGSGSIRIRVVMRMAGGRAVQLAVAKLLKAA